MGRNSETLWMSTWKQNFNCCLINTWHNLLICRKFASYILFDIAIIFEFPLTPFLWVNLTSTLSSPSPSLPITILYMAIKIDIHLGANVGISLFFPYANRMLWMALMLNICWQLTVLLGHMIWVVLPKIDGVAAKSMNTIQTGSYLLLSEVQ